MIKILKETPITLRGVDRMEQLVKDTECFAGEACDKCFYRFWCPDEEVFADCATVHGCTIDYQTYFILKTL